MSGLTSSAISLVAMLASFSIMFLIASVVWIRRRIEDGEMRVTAPEIDEDAPPAFAPVAEMLLAPMAFALLHLILRSSGRAPPTWAAILLGYLFVGAARAVRALADMRLTCTDEAADPKIVRRMILRARVMIGIVSLVLWPATLLSHSYYNAAVVRLHWERRRDRKKNGGAT